MQISPKSISAGLSSSELSVNDNFNCQVIFSNTGDLYQTSDLTFILFGYLIGHVKLNDLATRYQQSKGDLTELYSCLNGEFFLTIYDKRREKVIIFNDHIGSQSCYYYLKDKTLFISDSLKEINNVNGGALTLSNQALFNYLYFHCIPSPTTIYNDVYKLEPGKAVIYDSKATLSTQLLYQPEFTQTSNSADLKTECLTVIEEAVKESITENCGAFLSGGLDSSTVSGMLARHQAKAKTFSIGFEVAGYDETEYAQITANHFGTDHKVLYLKPEQAAQEFLNIVQHFDEPFGNSSSMAAYFCAKFAKEHGVTTLLAGDGGDELFAGNDRYAKQKQFELYYKLPSFVRTLLNGTLNNTFAAKVPGISKAASYVRQAEVTLPERLQSYNFINIVGLNEMFTSDFISTVDTNLPIEQLKQRYNEANSEHPVDRMLYLDWKFTLADNDLVKVNRMCELAGVTVRYPLLDKRVVDFSCQVSAETKLPGSRLRHFYKEACRGFLADKTLDKSKHGFGLPFGVWLKENEQLKTIALNALERFKSRKIVADTLIEKALSAHQSIHAGYYGELIWIIVVLELWLQNHESE